MLFDLTASTPTTPKINWEQITKTKEESTIYQGFVNAIRSPATRSVYLNSLRRYMKHLKITTLDQLLQTNENDNNPKVIEAQIIDYVMSLRQDGLSYETVKHLLAPIITFYQLNDILLNRKKIGRYFGEYRKVTKDKAYTTEQIGQALSTADHRMKMIILILASTGCRVGTLPELNLGHLTKLPEIGIYRILFYEGT